MHKPPYPTTLIEAQAIEKWAENQRLIENQYVTRHCSRGKCGRVILRTRIRYLDMSKAKPMQIAVMVTDALKMAARLRASIRP